MIDDSAPPLADQHPLRPLTAEEIKKVSALVRCASQFEPPIRFVYVSLVEPPKAEVLGTGAAPRPARRVKAVLRSPSRRATYEVVVCLDDEAVISWLHLTGAQPSLTPDELLTAEAAVRADPRWQAAMRRRGVADLSLAMIDPWPLGHWGAGDDPHRGRFVRPLSGYFGHLTMAAGGNSHS